jgi:hypothetical protein
LRGTFNANVNEIMDGAASTGLSIVNTLCWSAAVVGATTSVDAPIDDAVMSSASANVTAFVRKFNDAVPTCASALVVTAVITITSHLVHASIVAVSAVSVNVAVVRAEFVPAIENCVVPHPFFVNSGDGNVPNVKLGSTSATLSFTFSGAVSSNAYEIDDSAYVTGLAIVSLLYVKLALVTAGETSMLSAVMSAIGAARSTCTVRSAAFAVACCFALVVTPVATYTVHCL